MSKISAYPAASSLAGTDVVVGVVGGATKKIALSLIQQATLDAMRPLDIPPLTPHAKDDEFTGTSLDGKWTNPANSLAGATLTLAVGGGWLNFFPASGAPAVTGVYGIRQNAPAGSFTVSAKIDDLGFDASDGCLLGLWVGITGNRAWYCGMSAFSTGGPYLVYAFEASSYSESVAWGGYTSGVNASVAMASKVAVPLYGRWYRISYDAGTSTLTFYYSTNGVIWTLLTTQTSVAQPTRIGLGFGGAVPLTTRRLAASWFRVTEP